MSKLKCNFTDDLKAEFPFLKEESGGGRRKVFCTFCKPSFSIEHGGRSDVLQHTKVKKHNLLNQVEFPHRNSRRFFKVKRYE
jgi:hypothetical protein